MKWTIFEHNGKRHRMAVANSGPGVWIGYNGGAVFVRPQERCAAGEVDGVVRAPMTGKVVHVRVAKGDIVRANDLLVILEAMKMEYRLTARKDGTVGEVLCATGDLIDSGAVLVRLEESAAA